MWESNFFSWQVSLRQKSPLLKAKEKSELKRNSCMIGCCFGLTSCLIKFSSRNREKGNFPLPKTFHLRPNFMKWKKIHRNGEKMIGFFFSEERNIFLVTISYYASASGFIMEVGGRWKDSKDFLSIFVIIKEKMEEKKILGPKRTFDADIFWQLR